MSIENAKAVSGSTADQTKKICSNNSCSDVASNITVFSYNNTYDKDEWIIPEISVDLTEDTKIQVMVGGKLCNGKGIMDQHNDMVRELCNGAKDKECVNVIPYPNVTTLAEMALAVYTERFKGETNTQYENRLKLCSGWKLLASASNEQYNNGYFAIAVWNADLQHVIVSHRGTRLTNGSDWLTNIFGIMYNKYAPRVQSAITFVDRIVKVLNEINANKKQGSRFEYRLSLTGHSMGAWLAQITAFSAEHLMVQESGDITMRLVSDDTPELLQPHTVVFESPGCREMLKKLKNDLERYNRKINLRKLDITSYLSAPNRVNTYKMHVGTLYRIVTELPKINGFISYLKETHKMLNMLEAFKRNHTIHEILDWPLNTKIITTESVKNATLDNNYHINTNKFSEDHYKVRLCEGNRCSLNIFIDKEIEILQTWDILSNFGCDFNKLCEYANMFTVKTPKELIPDFKLKEGYIESKSEAELNCVIKHVKQLVRWYHTEVTRALVEHMIEIPTSKKEKLQLESVKFLSTLPECHVSFIDIVGLERFLESEDQYFLLSVEDSDFEMMRCYNILKQLENKCKDNVSKYLGSMNQCFFDMNQFLHNDYVDNTFMNSVNSFNLLFIRCIFQSTNSLEDSMPLLKERLNFMKELCGKKVIFLVTFKFPNHNLTTTFLDNINTKYNIPEPLSFTHLTERAQVEIIEKKLILLSGKELSLKDFMGENLSSNADKSIINSLLDSHDLKRIILNKSIVFNLGCTLLNLCDKEVAYADLHNNVTQENLLHFISNLNDSNCNQNFIISGVSQKFENTSEWIKLKSLARDNIFTTESIESGEMLFKEKCREHSHLIWYLLEQSDLQIKCKRVYDSELYIKRKFSNRNAINAEIINNIGSKKHDNLFIFQDVDNIHLQNMFDQIPNVRILPVGKSFNEFKDNYFENVHLLSAANYSDNQQYFTWLKSVGNLSILQRYVNVPEKDLNDPITEQALCDNMSKVGVIADEPGMGKTTTLINMSELMKSFWVICFNLKTMQIPIKKMPTEPNIDDIVKFLLSSNNNSASKLLKFCLVNRGSRQVCLLFDGFDELREEVDGKIRCKIIQGKFLKILKFLCDKTTASILVTTRKYPSEILENELSVFAMKFEKISKTQQIEFLVKFWQHNVTLELPNYVEKKDKFLQNLAKKLYAKTEKLLGPDIIEFLGIPLQMRMLAETYLPKVKQQMGLHVASYQQPIKIETLSNFYEVFIRARYDVYLNDKCGLNSSTEVLKRWMRNKFNDAHEIFSFRQLIPNGNNYLVNNLKDDEILEINRVGLIHLSSDGSYVELIHQTIAEYFVANLLIRSLKAVKDQKTIIVSQFNRPDIEDLFLTKIFLSGDFKTVRRFINDKLIEIYQTSNGSNIITLNVNSFSMIQTQIYDENYQTALHIAIRERFKGIFEYILTDLISQTSIGHYLTFITARDLQNNTALYIAARDKVLSFDYLSNYLGKCSTLVKHNIILSSVIKIVENDCEGYNFLLNSYLLCRIEHSVIHGKESITEKIENMHEAVENVNLRTLQEIVNAVPNDLEREYFLNSKYGKGWSLLHSAVKKSRYEIVEYLVQSRVQIDAVDREGKTALQYAVILPSGNDTLRIVKLLVEYGADVTHCDIFRMSVLAWCARDGCTEVLEYLLTLALFDSGEGINNPDRNEISPVQHAAKSGKLNNVKTLITKGADYLHRDRFGYTALSWAAHKGKLPVVKYLHEEKGCDINWLNRYDMSILLIAIKFKHSKVAEYLIKKHADINKGDWNGVTPLHMAHRGGMKSIVDLLVSFGAH